MHHTGLSLYKTQCQNSKFNILESSSLYPGVGHTMTILIFNIITIQALGVLANNHLWLDCNTADLSVLKEVIVLVSRCCSERLGDFWDVPLLRGRPAPQSGSLQPGTSGAFKINTNVWAPPQASSISISRGGAQAPSVFQSFLHE